MARNNKSQGTKQNLQRKPTPAGARPKAAGATVKDKRKLQTLDESSDEEYLTADEGTKQNGLTKPTADGARSKAAGAKVKGKRNIESLDDSSDDEYLTGDELGEEYTTKAESKSEV